MGGQPALEDYHKVRYDRIDGAITESVDVVIRNYYKDELVKTYLTSAPHLLREELRELIFLISPDIIKTEVFKSLVEVCMGKANGYWSRSKNRRDLVWTSKPLREYSHVFNINCPSSDPSKIHPSHNFKRFLVHDLRVLVDGLVITKNSLEFDHTIGRTYLEERDLSIYTDPVLVKLIGPRRTKAMWTQSRDLIERDIASSWGQNKTSYTPLPDVSLLPPVTLPCLTLDLSNRKITLLTKDYIREYPDAINRELIATIDAYKTSQYRRLTLLSIANLITYYEDFSAMAAETSLINNGIISSGRGLILDLATRKMSVVLRDIKLLSGDPENVNQEIMKITGESEISLAYIKFGRQIEALRRETSGLGGVPSTISAMAVDVIREELYKTPSGITIIKKNDHVRNQGSVNPEFLDNSKELELSGIEGEYRSLTTMAYKGGRGESFAYGVNKTET